MKSTAGNIILSSAQKLADGKLSLARPTTRKQIAAKKLKQTSSSANAEKPRDTCCVLGG